MSLAVAVLHPSELANQSNNGSPVSTEDYQPTEIPEFETVQDVLDTFHAADRDLQATAAAAAEQQKVSKEATLALKELKAAVYRQLEYLQRFRSQRGESRNALLLKQAEADLISWKDYITHFQQTFPWLGTVRNIQHHIADLRGIKRKRKKPAASVTLSQAPEQKQTGNVAPECDCRQMIIDAMTKFYAGASIKDMEKLFDKYCKLLDWEPATKVDRTPKKKEPKTDIWDNENRKAVEKIVATKIKNKVPGLLPVHG